MSGAGEGVQVAPEHRAQLVRPDQVGVLDGLQGEAVQQGGEAAGLQFEVEAGREGAGAFRLDQDPGPSATRRRGTVVRAGCGRR